MPDQSRTERVADQILVFQAPFKIKKDLSLRNLLLSGTDVRICSMTTTAGHELCMYSITIIKFVSIQRCISDIDSALRVLLLV